MYKSILIKYCLKTIFQVIVIYPGKSAVSLQDFYNSKIKYVLKMAYNTIL